MSKSIKCLIVGNDLEHKGQDIKTLFAHKCFNQISLSSANIDATEIPFGGLSTFFAADNSFHDFNIDTTAGLEPYEKLLNLRYQSATLIIILFSLQNHASFDKVTTWHKNIKESMPNVPLLLVSYDKTTKATVTEEEAADLASTLTIPYFNYNFLAPRTIQKIMQEVTFMGLNNGISLKTKYPFFYEKFPNVSSGLLFAKQVAQVGRGHYQENNVLNKLPIELVYQILIHVSSNLTKDEAAYLLCQSVLNSVSTAKATTGKEMQWCRSIMYKENVVQVYAEPVLETKVDAPIPSRRCITM